MLAGFLPIALIYEVAEGLYLYGFRRMLVALAIGVVVTVAAAVASL